MAETTDWRCTPSVEGPTPRSSSKVFISRCTTSAITSSRREAIMTSIALPKSGVASGALAAVNSWLMRSISWVLEVVTASISGVRISESIGQKLFSQASTTNSERSSHRA